MPSKRTYKVRVSKDFIVLAVASIFFCLWAVRDAWFTTEQKLKEHPRMVEASFSIDGSIKGFGVKVGDPVVPPKSKDGRVPSLLASLNDTNLQIELKSKTAAYVALQHGSAEKKALEEEIRRLRVQLKKYQVSCPKLGVEKGGKVIKLLVNRYDTVKAGQPVIEIEPNSHFYLFNQSLAIFCFFAFWIFLALHLFAT